MKYNHEKQQRLSIHKLNICNFTPNKYKEHEDDLIEILENAYYFAFSEYTDEYEDWPGRYEWNTAITGFFNDLIILWENYPEIAQSEKIKSHLFELLKKEEKWLYSKDHVVYILMLWGDRSRIFKAAKEMPDLWKGTEFLQYRLMEAVYKLKIPGFSKEAELMQKIAENDGDKKMKNFASRYLANEYKYKQIPGT
ncbi:hypothetical protein CO608_08860 [Lysobacteraceae bacterium NML08-0793]|nr:hypothetical protein CO608_08860 [Xanthomonadaceae bacterium NML08-0793]